MLRLVQAASCWLHAGLPLRVWRAHRSSWLPLHGLAIPFTSPVCAGQVEAGSFTDSEIIVMLGENGTGKTTFIRMLAGMLKPGEYLSLLAC
jgi:ABC-type uncharacterized transport system ATPase subunit